MIAQLEFLAWLFVFVIALAVILGASAVIAGVVEGIQRGRDRSRRR